MAEVNHRVLAIAQEVAAEMRSRGAAAAVLMGSHVRGDAHAESDIDLTFIGRDEPGRIERRGDHLVSITWRSVESITRGYRNPAEVCGLVPAWRRAMILHDPDGLAVRLKREADAWSWEPLASACDRWVAEQITGWAEEVHRIVGCLQRGNVVMAGVERSVLAIRLATVLAVHLRLLYDTENHLWALVSERMGEPWATVQSAALGCGDESFAASCEAALRLYRLAAARTRHLLDEAQYPVVRHACDIAGWPLPARGSAGD